MLTKNSISFLDFTVIDALNDEKEINLIKQLDGHNVKIINSIANKKLKYKIVEKIYLIIVDKNNRKINKFILNVKIQNLPFRIDFKKKNKSIL